MVTITSSRRIHGLEPRVAHTLQSQRKEWVAFDSPTPTPATPAPTLTPASGFTLIELLIVMVIIATLAAMAIPAYTRVVLSAREAVLKEDLYVMRKAIDSYTVDKQKAPQSLDDLVTGGYLKAIPKDPLTGHTDTWTVAQSDNLATVDQTDSGIDDVHSGSQQISTEGNTYSSW